jgi:hypothetical protein
MAKTNANKFKASYISKYSKLNLKGNNQKANENSIKMQI